MHEVDFFKNKWQDVADDVSIWKPHNWSNGREYRIQHGERRSCNRPFTGPVQIQWDGKVVPCCWDYNNSIVLGDVNTQAIEEVLKGEKYEMLRNVHASGEFHKVPFCNSCDQLYNADDALIFTTIKTSKVGKTNTNQFSLS